MRGRQRGGRIARRTDTTLRAGATLRTSATFRAGTTMRLETLLRALSDALAPGFAVAGVAGAGGPVGAGALGGVVAITAHPEAAGPGARRPGGGYDSGGYGVDASSVEAILARAQAGDAEAFGLLYDRYVSVVHRYLYFRLGNRAVAEDLTSETFLRALRRITSFTWQGRDFGAWLVTIARNLVADHYKSGRYRMEVTTSDLLGAGADRPTEGPEQQVLAAMTNAVLVKAVHALGPDQQECIVLRFLQGMSVAETALIMGKNEGAIKALQYRAIRALSRLLPEGFAP